MRSLFVTRTLLLFQTIPLVITGTLFIILTRSHRVDHRSQDRIRTCDLWKSWLVTAYHALTSELPDYIWGNLKVLPPLLSVVWVLGLGLKTPSVRKKTAVSGNLPNPSTSTFVTLTSQQCSQLGRVPKKTTLLIKGDRTQSSGPDTYRFAMLSPVRDTLSQYCRLWGQCAQYTIINREFRTSQS